MPKKPDKSRFVAPIVHGATENASEGSFEQRLVGFCVTARLDQLPDSRSWWSKRLGISRSHMVKMVNAPTTSFVEDLDQVLADERAEDDGDPARAQRLNPRLSDFYADIRPDHRTTNPQPVLEWLARDPQVFASRRAAAGYLLESEVALKRCELRANSRLLEDDELVIQSLRNLMSLASGPYGAATVAHQRCVEIGLLVPETFFDVITEHFDSSPVGFRLLRTLDRFVNVWRRRENDPELQRIGPPRIGSRLASLLLALGKAAKDTPYIDPYPGREWATTLAWDCLRTGRELRVARDVVRAAYSDSERSDRERLYAAWADLAHAKESHSTDDPIEIFRDSNSEFLALWGDLFTDLAVGEFVTEEEQQAKARLKFKAEADIVETSVSCHASGMELDGVRDALASVIFASLVTPDGRLRRQLIEGVVAAELVAPTARVLVDVYKASNLVGIKESAIFLLSRLRQPDDEVVELLRRAATGDGHASVKYSALWGLGDIFRRRDAERVDDFLSTLGRTTALRRDKQPLPLRVAATHALAVIAWKLRPFEGREEEDERKSSLVAGEAVLEILGAAPDPVTTDGVDRVVGGLAKWGIDMNSPRISDPTSLDVTGLLGHHFAPVSLRRAVPIPLA